MKAHESDTKAIPGSCGGWRPRSAAGERRDRKPAWRGLGWLEIKPRSTRFGSWCPIAFTTGASVASTGCNNVLASALRLSRRALRKRRRRSSTRCSPNSAPPTRITIRRKIQPTTSLRIFSSSRLEHRGLERVFPLNEVSYPGIGVFTEADDQGRTFVTGVIEGAPLMPPGFCLATKSCPRTLARFFQSAPSAARLDHPSRSKSAAPPAPRRSQSPCRLPICIQARCSCAASKRARVSS